MKFSIVVPCYNEEAALPHLMAQLRPILDRECAAPDGWELILIDDGSRDRTLDEILRLNHEDPRVRGVSLSRNFGHQAAVNVGLSYASGDWVGVMDCDLQDSPEVLAQLLNKVRREGYDVAFAVRRTREAVWLKRVCYRAFYRLMAALAEHPFPENAGDFSVFNRRVHETLLSLPESVRVLRGLRSWVGFRQCEIPVDRPDRKHGSSKYGWLRLFSLAMSSITGFSYVPLRIASLAGLGMGIFALVLGLLFLLNRTIPHFTPLSYYIGVSPGTTTLILYLSIVSSMLFFCMGIMGEYLVIILKEVKKRPVAVTKAVIGELAAPSHATTRSNMLASEPAEIK
jgi:dolichol-phosphate mannosyltransferase